MTSAARTYRVLEPGNLPGPVGMAAIGVAAAFIAVLGLLIPDLAGIAIDRGITLAVPALVMGVIALCWANERYWVYLAILSHLLFMVDATPDTIGIGEVAFGTIGLAGLAFWFFKEVVIGRRRILESGFDLLLLTFMLASTITTLTANLLHGGDLLQYVKEYGVVVDLLLYFPLKKVTASRRDVMILIFLFCVVGLVNGGVSFLTYRERLAEAVFQWQLAGSRSNLNESTSQALFVVGTTIFAYARTLWMRIASLLMAAGGLVFLLVSFSRSPIVAAVLALMIMVALSPLRNGRRVVVAMLLAIVVGASAAYLIFPQIATSVGQSIVNRVVSVAETGSDRSFKARLVESSAILNNYFAYSPVLGVGYGVRFKFLDPISGTTIQGVFVHNGYVWSLFKLGIPIALLFYAMLMYPMVRLMVHAPRRHEGFNRALMAGAAGYMICAFIVNFTSNLFTQVSTILNIVICWTLFDYVRRGAIGRDAALAASPAGDGTPGLAGPDQSVPPANANQPGAGALGGAAIA